MGKKRKKQEKLLYHHTTFGHLLDIIESGYIKRTPSDLTLPKDITIDKAESEWVGDNDDYRPVVWLTSSANVTQESLGTVQQVEPAWRKDVVSIAVRKANDIHSWFAWHTSNGGEPEVVKRFQETAPDWSNWYICEREIPVDEFAEIRVLGNLVTVEEVERLIGRFKASIDENGLQLDGMPLGRFVETHFDLGKILGV